jgi:hypothetical protein
VRVSQLNNNRATDIIGCRFLWPILTRTQYAAQGANDREEWVKKLLGWRNSGFSIHNQVKIKRGQAGAGKPGPVYPPFPIFSGENDLPATE